ncbi:MAG: hypothetical protein JNK68_10955 [Betaproteobacteria bacterium]|nr:hypothetical protein [Betaproteobacteria bacterium]
MDYASTDPTALGAPTASTAPNPVTAAVEWDEAKQTCVPRPATGLGRFEDPRRLLEDIRVDDDDRIAVLLHKFVGAALTIESSLTTLNLVRLYCNDDYRALALKAAHLGIDRGHDAALAEWGGIFDEFIDQLLVVTANSLEDPGAIIVGTAATAIQLYGNDPLAKAAAEHRQLNDWIRRARKDIWAGITPPKPPELPDDDLAQAKAAFVVEILTQVFGIIYDPPSVFFAALSIPDIVEAYRAWDAAEVADEDKFVPVLLTAVCEPAVLGYNLAFRHGQADVDTVFSVALRLGDWLPSPI